MRRNNIIVWSVSFILALILLIIWFVNFVTVDAPLDFIIWACIMIFLAIGGYVLYQTDKEWKQLCHLIFIYDDHTYQIAGAGNEYFMFNPDTFINHINKTFQDMSYSYSQTQIAENEQNKTLLATIVTEKYSKQDWACFIEYCGENTIEKDFDSEEELLEILKEL